MTTNVRQQGVNVKLSRRTLRLTFRFANGEVRLLSYQRVDMICPPSIGERPEAGKHSGFWMELRGASGGVLFHRVLHSPFIRSARSPDGKVYLGTVAESVIEVLLPDDAAAKSVALIGQFLDAAKATQESARGTRELARFDLPKG